MAKVKYSQGLKLREVVGKSGKKIIHLAKISGISKQSIYNFFKMDELEKKKVMPLLDILDITWDDFTGSKSVSEVDELKRQLKEMQDDRDKWKDKYIACMEENKAIEQDSKKNKPAVKPAFIQQLKR